MIRTSVLALAAIAALTASALVPTGASAFGLRATAPTRVVITSHPGRTLGWGYGRGWCYWHPYMCYRY
jgi:hypothetical protein